MPSKLERITPEGLLGNPRATLSAWCRYEPIVKAAIRQHPRPYIYTPKNRTAATVCSQLRDAIRGKLAFDYPSDLHNTDLLKWYSEIVIRRDTTSVYLGPIEPVNEAIIGHGTPSSNDTTLHFDSLSFEEAAAFCLLLSTAKLSGPIVIRNPPDLTLLPERTNVERLDRPDGSVVLL